MLIILRLGRHLAEAPNKSPEPTAVGAVSSAVAEDVISPAGLSWTLGGIEHLL